MNPTERFMLNPSCVPEHLDPVLAGAARICRDALRRARADLRRQADYAEQLRSQLADLCDDWDEIPY